MIRAPKYHIVLFYIFIATVNCRFS